MELHQLEVLDPAPGGHTQIDTVAEVFVGSGGAAAPQSGVSAAAQDHRIGQKGGRGAIMQIEGKGAKTGTVGNEE
jgi:hypothetical protein